MAASLRAESRAPRAVSAPLRAAPWSGRGPRALFGDATSLLVSTGAPRPVKPLVHTPVRPRSRRTLASASGCFQRSREAPSGTSRTSFRLPALTRAHKHGVPQSAESRARRARFRPSASARVSVAGATETRPLSPECERPRVSSWRNCSRRHAGVLAPARQPPARYRRAGVSVEPSAPRQCAAVARAAAHVARAAMRAITHVEGKAIGSSRRPRRRAARWLRRQLRPARTVALARMSSLSTARAGLGALLAIGVAPDRGRWRGRGWCSVSVVRIAPARRVGRP